MNDQPRIHYLWGIVPVFAMLLLWETTARLQLIPGGVFFPPFTTVMAEVGEMLSGGVLIPNFMSSLGRVLAGFISGSVCGISTGILMGWNERANRWFSPKHSGYGNHKGF